MNAALHYLHDRGLLHLDVKPSNVVADSGRAKLIDLSIERPPGRYRPCIGTWCNPSPEQARGDALGPPADGWGARHRRPALDKVAKRLKPTAT